MIISGFWLVFGCGCLGGILAEVAKWSALREASEFPAYCRKARYWVITAIMVSAGGVLSVLYGTEARNAMLVLNIGASAPLIIRSLAATAPSGHVPSGGKLVESKEETEINEVEEVVHHHGKRELLNFLAGRK